jgi:hypothetical protein
MPKIVTSIGLCALVLTLAAACATGENGAYPSASPGSKYPMGPSGTPGEIVPEPGR